MRYKFTGKERDEEKSYDYFGARYYNSDIGRWMAVDPLADKYPGLSPYSYCASNPLKYIDPNGEDIKPANPSDAEKWKNTQGKLMLSKEGRSLLAFYKNLPYDVRLSYTQLPIKVLGQIDIKYKYKVDRKSGKYTYTKAKINTIELDDNKKEYDDVATPAEELSHGKDAIEDPNTYYNNKKNATSYSTNQNEINGKKNAQKVKEEYEKAKEEKKSE